MVRSRFRRTILSRKTSFPVGAILNGDPHERVGRLDISSKLPLAMAVWSKVEETAVEWGVSFTGITVGRALHLDVPGAFVSDVEAIWLK